MKTSFGKYFLPILALIALTFSIYQVVRAHQVSPTQDPPMEPPRTPFGKTIAGAGVVESETENISIGAPLPGLVLQVYVPVDKVGQIVKAGEPLFLVDNRALKAQLEFAQANLLAAEAQVAKLNAQPQPETVPPLEAAYEAAKANTALQEDTAKRNVKLIGQNAVSATDYMHSILQVKQAKAMETQAEKNLVLLKAGAWKYDIDIAKANVAVSRAQVKQIETDLERVLVRAPVDGKVLQVNVRPGEYVGTPPSQALVVIGSVARLHVRVDIDEHDIPRAYPLFKTGVSAFASPRGDPSKKAALSFMRVEPYVIAKTSLTGDNTERVDTRVLQVIYRLDHEDPGWYVGMQVDVFLNGDGTFMSAK